MKTAQREIGRAFFATTIADAASGSGVASGLPYVFTRTATGVYAVSFDSRILPESVVVVVTSGTGYATVTAMASGTFTVQTYITTTATNLSFRWQMTALDKRL